MLYSEKKGDEGAGAAAENRPKDSLIELPEVNEKDPVKKEDPNKLLADYGYKIKEGASSDSSELLQPAKFFPDNEQQQANPHDHSLPTIFINGYPEKASWSYQI
eukprot:TRINITY_DN12071_c0_g1_i30.p2 TRINITY_DN12071_c0_g1~~TRINITY_DN12071_c0_g1_i30.p2  ORF type:complete len:104 (-),score=25.43 TRINITY_DN12071_c0_g1_i30:42-353(-)